MGIRVRIGVVYKGRPVRAIPSAKARVFWTLPKAKKVLKKG